MLISTWRMGLLLMEVVLSVVKTGLRLYKESWPIVISRVSCAVGKKSCFSLCLELDLTFIQKAGYRWLDTKYSSKTFKCRIERYAKYKQYGKREFFSKKL